MKKNAFFILISILVASILIYFVFDEIGTQEIWQTFLSFSPKGVFWVSILTILSVILNAWRWQIILRERGDNLSLSKLIVAWISGFSIGYFTPIAMAGDEVVKTYILKNKFSVPLKKATVSVFLEDLILDGSIFYLTIIIGVFFFILKAMIIPLELWMILLILAFPIGGLIFFYFKVFKTQSMIRIIKGPLQRFTNSKIADGLIRYEQEVLDFFKAKNKEMWQAIIISFFHGIVKVLRLWAIILFLGIKIDLITVISISAFSNLAYVFPLPAALGSLEALQAFAFSNLGLTPQIAVAFSLILRAADTLVALIGLFFALKFGTKVVKEKIGLQNPVKNR